ncbi:MAG: peptide MFS transporter [Rhizomicrobium sp.]
MTANTTANAVAPPTRPRTFFGHPIGLGFLAFTEAWERFSFYGMQTLLVLYMVDLALKPGHVEHILGFGALRGFIHMITSGRLTVQALASQVFGLYTATVYVTPLLGGWIGDNWLGRTRAILFGASLMAVGQFLMVFEASFVIALVCLVFGAGFIKGNIAAQVGALYPDDHARRDEAFQIFVLAVNAGVIAAPLICGTLGELLGWRYGFMAAGVGMLFAIGIYLSGRRDLPADIIDTRNTTTRTPLTREEWGRIVALVALVPIIAVAFVINNQIYNAYIVWAQDTANLSIFGWHMPVTWLLAYDAGVSTAFLAAAVFVWRWLANKGIAPHELTKMAVGCAITILGALWLALAAYVSGTGKVALPWLIVFHIINTVGFVSLYPFAMALFSRAAPPSVNAMMIGIFYLSLFGTNLMVGWVGALYSSLPHTTFWLVHAGFAATSTVAILLFYRPLRKALTPETGDYRAGTTVATQDR